MKRKSGIVLMCFGAVLLGMALSLFLYNSIQSENAQANTTNLMPQIIAQIETEETNPTEETRSAVIPGAPSELLDPPAFEMTEVEIDGNKYIGYLSIPDLGLELPIMSDWSYSKLQISPCRYSGTVLSEDLVLFAHNYTSHFGKLQNLSVGADVLFTDMDGITTQYEVMGIEILPPTAVEDMTSGLFDLTLFTCTLGGKSRVTVRCDRVTSNFAPQGCMRD